MNSAPASLPAQADVVIVGAGAAGLATAAFIRELAPSRDVLILDGAKTPGAKILVSGGGRCNVTNATVTERDFSGGAPSIVRQILRAFPVRDTRAWFSRLGVELHEEPGGKLFPDSNRARDVLDALLGEVDRQGATLLSNHRVTDVSRTSDGFLLTTSHGTVSARTVVLAAGGRALPKSGSDGTGYDLARRLGHTLVDTTPALAPLLLDETHEHLHQTLSGVAHPAELTVWVDGRVAVRLAGALLWTHFGISGPVALDTSRHWARATLEGRAVATTLSFLPGLRFDAVDAQLVALLRERPRATTATLLSHWLPASVARALASACGIDEATEGTGLSRDTRRRLAHALSEWPLAVTGTRGYTYAEVTAGGVPLGELDSATLESRACRGLYLVGEILDVDGRLGGFNFQWAWSSARVAARGIGRT
jgi:predicted Rossmann fold flavoprotein